MKKQSLLFVGVVIIIGLLWYVWPSDQLELVSDNEPITHNDIIVVTSPLADEAVTSPITVTGEARGQWFFEASFPLTLTDRNGHIIAEGYARADAEWMTPEYVPFTGTIEYNSAELVGVSSDRGFLILHKSNESGLHDRDDAVEIPIRFAD